MTLTEPQSRLIPLLEQRLTPQEITMRLGVSRQRLHVLLAELTVLGLLRKPGELPTLIEVATSTKPTQERMDGDALARTLLGWDPELIRRADLEHSKAGMVIPESDDRYTRATWTGHTVRRVDLDFGSHWWTVQGLLVPRADNRPWSKAAPVYRSVLVSSGTEAWVPIGGGPMQRNTIVSMTLVSAAFPAESLDDVIGLTMAIAWVMESRALLDAESLNSSILGGG